MTKIVSVIVERMAPVYIVSFGKLDNFKKQHLAAYQTSVACKCVRVFSKLT